MAMAMVQVRKMGMGVEQGRMAVPMRMRLSCRIGGGVRMLVMGVMRMHVLVFQWVVPVRVLVAFGEMQVKPDRHQNRRRQKRERDRLRQDRNA